MRRLIIGVASLVVVACSSETDPALSTDGPSCAGTTNLLKNPELNSSDETTVLDWNGTQHGAIHSFSGSVEAGTLTIERTGPEPWYTLQQFVNLKEHIGHQMLYQADLKLSLNGDDWPHAFEPKGGLKVLIRAFGEPAILGSRLAIDSSAEHSPNLGTTDWFRAYQVFTVPERLDSAMFGLIFQANGSMSFRNPGLFDCGPAPEPEA